MGMKVCARKKARTAQAKVDGDGDDEEFEMANRGMYANPLRELEEAKKQARDANKRALALEESQKLSKQQQAQLVSQMKRLKQENQRQQLAHRRGANTRTPRRKKEMAQ